MRPRAALQPPSRALHGKLRLFVGIAVFRTLIERHDDVRTEVVLDLHGEFGRKSVATPVHMGRKVTPSSVILLSDESEKT